VTWTCPNCGTDYPDSDGGLPRDAHAFEKDRCLSCADTSVAFDADDWGSGEVQDNGMLYVGREHAGEAVRWLLERE